MRDPKRTDRMVEKLRKIWTDSLDMRLCQLLYKIAAEKGYRENDLFYYEDKEIEKGMNKLLGVKK